MIKQKESPLKRFTHQCASSIVEELRSNKFKLILEKDVVDPLIQYIINKMFPFGLMLVVLLCLNVILLIVIIIVKK